MAFCAQAAVLMLVGGIVLLILGSLVAAFEHFNRGMAFVVLGVLLFLPGNAIPFQAS